MKPDITFFGEDLPATFHNRLMDHDRDLVDLVLVIGTSLKVAPVSEVVGVLPHHVPQLYISREVSSHHIPSWGGGRHPVDTDLFTALFSR